jgi:hypothetical protein
LAKPDWPSKRRDGDRDRNVREPLRDNVVMYPGSSRPSRGPRQDHSKPQIAKQGVKGALRAANLRLLLGTVPVPEALALVAEVPLERLEAMSQGALCPDETAFHIERILKLPGKWLDGLNKAVPERTLELLKNPDRAGLHDDEDFEDGSATLAPVVNAAAALPAAEVSAAAPPVPAPTPAAAHAPQALRADAADAAAAGTSAMATNAEGSGTTQAATAPAAKRAAAFAEAQLHLSEIAPPSQPGLEESSSMASPELRKQNLTLLLQGKGAKSALARILHIKPSNVPAMLSGRKSLDAELCRGMARTLGLPDNWFEAPRTAAAIPAATRQRLAPLQDTATNASTAPSSRDTAEAASAPTAASGTSAAAVSATAEPGEFSTVRAATAEGDNAACAEPTRRHARSAAPNDNPPFIEPTALVGEPASGWITKPAQPDRLAPVEPDAQRATQAPASALRSEAVVPLPVSNTAPVTAAASIQQPTRQVIDFTPVWSQPLAIEGGLAPITQALIKLLMLKAKQGALSEDKAFELLGVLRLL